MRLGKIVSNAAKFPNVTPSGIKGLLTLNTIRYTGNAGAFPPSIPIPLFAPGLMNATYKTLMTYLDLHDVATGLNYGLAAIQGQFPGTNGYPGAPIINTYTDGNGVLMGTLVFDFKEIAYNDMQAMLAGGDLLRITNMRLRYKLKIPSADQRNQVITFFSQDIFGRPDFQQLTISQYFDPETNKTSNNDADYFEVVDIPVDFFASNTSGICVNFSSTNNSLDLSQFGGMQITFMVSHYFNHVKENKKSIL